MESSYKKRVQERDEALKLVEDLKSALVDKGNIFFKECKWLGMGYTAYCTVVDGEMMEIKRGRWIP